MKIKSYPFITLFIVLMTSCATSKSIMVDVKTPGRVVFPASVAKIALVDNSAQVEIDPIIDPTLYNVQITKGTFMKAMNQFINDEKFFTSSTLDTIPLRNDSIIEDLHVMNRNKVLSITQRNNVDAIVVLDIYNLEENPVIIKNDFGYDLSMDAYYITAIMSIYGQDGRRIANTFAATSDTIFKFSRDGSPIEQEVINNLALRVADNSTKILLPYWQKQERVIFNTGTKNDKAANAKVKEGKWSDAAVLWGEDYKKETSKSKKSKLSANIALCNEMLTDIDYSIEWINSALALNDGEKKNYTETIKWYKNRLEERKKDFPKLQKQLKGN